MQSLHSYVALSQLADRHAAAASARAVRRASDERHRAAAVLPANVVLRRAGAQDSAAIARLAELDGAVQPTGEMLVAKVDDQIVAAVPLHGGRAIADPFRPTAGLVALLRDRARPQAGGASRKRLPRLRMPRLRVA